MKDGEGAVPHTASGPHVQFRPWFWSVLSTAISWPSPTPSPRVVLGGEWPEAKLGGRPFKELRELLRSETRRPGGLNSSFSVACCHFSNLEGTWLCSMPCVQSPESQGAHSIFVWHSSHVESAMWARLGAGDLALLLSLTHHTSPLSPPLGERSSGLAWLSSPGSQRPLPDWYPIWCGLWEKAVATGHSKGT